MQQCYLHCIKLYNSNNTPILENIPTYPPPTHTHTPPTTTTHSPHPPTHPTQKKKKKKKKERIKEKGVTQSYYTGLITTRSIIKCFVYGNCHIPGPGPHCYSHHRFDQPQIQNDRILSPQLEQGARRSSVVRAFAHGAMGRRIDPSWWTHWAISRSSQC